MKHYFVVILTIFIILGGIFIFDTMGLWQPESTKIPIKTAEGFSDPGDIRGSYSFSDIETSFGVSVEDLAKAYQISDNPSAFQLKSLESIYDQKTTEQGEVIEIGTGSVKYFVHLVTGIKSTLVEPEWLPKTAVDFLLSEGIIDMNSEAILWAVDISPHEARSQKESTVEPLIKGNTTVQDLLNLGLKIEDLEAIIGFDIERGEVIKNICIENDLPFSEIKLEILEYMEN